MRPSPPLPIGVLCVDDCHGFREVLRDLVAATPGFSLLGEAASGPEAIAAVQEHGPDLILMDVRMPGIDGIETAQRLLGGDPNLVVVLMSADEMPEPSGIDMLGPKVFFVLKDHLSSSLLLDLWRGRRTGGGPNWIPFRLG